MLSSIEFTKKEVLDYSFYYEEILTEKGTCYRGTCSIYVEIYLFFLNSDNLSKNAR